MTRDPNPQLMFSEAIGPWETWFAWHPVRTFDGHLVWLTDVRRRPLALYSEFRWFWQYHDQIRRTA